MFFLFISRGQVYLNIYYKLHSKNTCILAARSWYNTNRDNILNPQNKKKVNHNKII